MLPLIIALILSLCYSRTIAPSLTWAHFSADGGDLISAAATGGVAHPSGYPFYLILARGFQIIPIGDMAFRTNLLSAICTILTSLLLYVYLSHQLPDHPLSKYISFLAAIAYGLAPFVWGQAIVTEVYALHGLLMMICLYILSLEKSKISEWMRGFVFGIAATNHLTAMMILPLLVVRLDKKLFISGPILLKRSFGVAVGLSLYLSLPIRAYFDPPINWGDPISPNGFFWLITGQIYRQYLFSLHTVDIIQRLRGFGGLLLEQFTWIGALLGIYGMISLSQRRILIPTLWIGMVFLLFAVIYGSYDSQVYLIPVWLVFAIWLAFGLQDLIVMEINRLKLQVSIVGFMFVALMIRIPFQFSSIDVSKDFQAHDFITNALKIIPENSIVFVDGDKQVFSLWYAQFVLHQRLDLVIVAEGLLPYKWYHENLENAYPFLDVPQKDNLNPFGLSLANPGMAICFIPQDQPIICPQGR